MKRKGAKKLARLRNVPDADFKPRFSEKHLSDIEEWFDKNSQCLSGHHIDKTVKVVTIDQIMQFFEKKNFHKREFHYPTYGEVMVQAEKLKVQSSRVLTKHQLLFMLDTWIIEPNLKHELKSAFKVFDSENRNFLDLDEIQVIVKGFGKPFDDKETLELLRDANVRGDGNVFYEDFVESLFNLAPELYEMKAEYLYENPDEDPSISQNPG